MFKETSFLKKANLFQPILVVVISIIGGTPMEGANTGKIVLLIILGAAFIVWHVECQRLLNRNRETREHACALKNRSAALYKKTYAALSGEYENFANKLNGESCREAKTDGSRGTTESFNGACLFLCSTIAAALAEYKNSLVFEVLYIQAERRKDQTLLHVTGYAQGEHNNDTPSLLAQPPRPVTKTPAMLDEQLFAERHLSPLVLSNPEEVQRSFFRKRNQPPEEKYMQYLAIPVLSKRNEIIGLIEIAVKKNPFISPVTMLEAHELADVKSWLYHLKDHFLLFHEIERAVRDGFP